MTQTQAQETTQTQAQETTQTLTVCDAIMCSHALNMFPQALCGRPRCAESGPCPHAREIKVEEGEAA